MNRKEYELLKKIVQNEILLHDAWVSKLQVESLKNQNQIPAQQADFALSNIKNKEDSLRKEIQDIERQLVTG